MNKKCECCLCGLLAILALGMRAAGADLVLSRDGSPAVGVYRLSYDSAIIRAADEFIAYMNGVLKRSDYTGYVEGAPVVNLALAGDGSCEAADRAMAATGKTRENLGTDGFLVAPDPDGGRNVLVCAYAPKGVLNGVYKLFEKAFGAVAVRPLVGLNWPERFETCEPITLPYSEKPFFSRRGLVLTGSKEEHPRENMYAWLGRNLMNDPGADVKSIAECGYLRARYGMLCDMCGHAFFRLIPAREYAKSHPEYFSLIDGVRRFEDHGSQLTLGNPEVVDLLVEKLIACKRRYPETKVLAFGYNDTCSDPKNPFGWSEDPLDLALDSPKDFPPPGSKRPRTFSTRYIKTANKVIARLNKVFPDVKLQVHAYHFSMMVPPDCEIHPNLVVAFCPLYKCCAHGLNDPNCPRNRYMADCLKGWAAKTKNVFVRDYYSTQDPFYPLMALHEIADDVRFYRDLGLAGVLPESLGDGPNGSNHGGFVSVARCRDDRWYEYHWDSNCLSYFALARLAWNPDEPVEGIVRLWCRNYYGRATAPAMVRYFLAVDANLRAAGHPGEIDPEAKDVGPTSSGKWCAAWNWAVPIGKWTRRLFAAETPADAKPQALALARILYEARDCADATRNQEIRNRFARDFDLFRRYLLSQGYELHEFRRKEPVFSREAFGFPVNR